jgi:amidase
MRLVAKFLPTLVIGIAWLSVLTVGQYRPNYKYKPKVSHVHIFSTTRGNTREMNLLEIDLSLAFCGDLNIREITIVGLQNALIRKQITSVELVRCYIKRIKAMDPFLNSILEINPDAESIAEQLDLKRSFDVFLGPLHGIPILIKDNIGTGDKMETTAGSVALLGIKPKADAEIVKKLRKAGAIIIGKANLSEFAK